MGQAYRQLAQHQKSAEKYQQALGIFRDLNNCSEEAEMLASLGTVYSELGRYSEAISSCQQALEILQKLGSHRSRLRVETNIWNCLGIVFYHQKEYLKSKENFQKALKIANEISSEKYTILANLGSLFCAQEQLQRAIRYFRQSLDANPGEEPNKEASTRSKLAHTYSRLASEYYNRAEYSVSIDLFKRALQYFDSIETRCYTQEEQRQDKDAKDAIWKILMTTEQALEKGYSAAAEQLNQSRAKTRESGDLQGEAEALLGLGTISHLMGKYEAARTNYAQALKVFQQVSDPDKAKGVANVWLGRSKIDYSLGEYKEAIKILIEKTLPTFETLEDSFGLADSCNALGCVNQALGKHKNAIEYHNQALTIAQSIGAHLKEADAQNGLGAAYCSIGQYPQAREHLDKALTTRKELSDRAGEGDTYCNFGNWYLAQADYKQAVQCYKAALVFSQLLGDG